MIVGDILKTEADYEAAPDGTKISYLLGLGDRQGDFFTKIDGRWYDARDTPDTHFSNESMACGRGRMVLFVPEIDPFAVGQTLAGSENYAKAPIGTEVAQRFVKIKKDKWLLIPVDWDGREIFHNASFEVGRKITAQWSLGELDLMGYTEPTPKPAVVEPTPEPEVPPRGTIHTETIEYKVSERTMSVIRNPHGSKAKALEQRIGKVVRYTTEAGAERWLAAPSRDVRDFETEDEAVKWLV